MPRFDDSDWLTEAAAETELTKDDLIRINDHLVEGVRDNLISEYEDSRLFGGPDRWILEQRNREVWIAYNLYDLQEVADEVGLDVSFEELGTVAWVHLKEFQETMDLTIGIHRRYVQSHKQPIHYPIYVHLSEEWQNGFTNVKQRLRRLMRYNDLSAAEALDYFAVRVLEEDSHEWAGSRGVSDEAVLKNLRAVEDKFEEEDNSGMHRDETLRLYRLDEVPEDGYDEDEDMHVVPEDFDLAG
jgi:hypothetical protein